MLITPGKEMPFSKDFSLSSTSHPLHYFRCLLRMLGNGIHPCLVAGGRHVSPLVAMILLLSANGARAIAAFSRY
ncbi:MAG: hypothetical protein ACLPXB_14060 [Thiobacillaceae bacterium]